MALLHIEGFEMADSEVALRRIVDCSNVGSMSSVEGRDGAPTRALRLSSGNHYVSFPLPNDTTRTFVIGFAFNLNFYPSSDQIFVRFVENDTTQIHLEFEANTGEIKIVRGGTDIATSSGAGIVAATWYYLEWKVLIDDSAGTYDVDLNGNNILTGTATDTKSSATDEVTCVQLIGRAGANYDYDDLYILDSTGTTNNDLLGPCTVETLFPDGDGNQNDFTPQSGLTNYEMVDDGSTPDAGTTYVSSSTVNHIDLYTFGDLQFTLNDIYGVEATALIKTQTPGPRQLRMMTRVSATNYESDAFGCTADYGHIYGLWETNPNTAVAWTESDVNGAEFGITVEA